MAVGSIMKRRIGHLWKRKRNKVLFGFISINILLLFLLYSNLFTYPNTFIGSTNISGKTAGQIRTILNKEQAVLPKIQVKDRTYTYTYSQIGVVVDTQQTIRDAFAPNKKLFPFFGSFFFKRVIQNPLVFTQAFDQFISDMTFNFGSPTDSVAVDPETNSLLVAENTETYRFDKNKS